MSDNPEQVQRIIAGYFEVLESSSGRRYRRSVEFRGGSIVWHFLYVRPDDDPVRFEVPGNEWRTVGEVETARLEEWYRSTIRYDVDRPKNRG